MEHKFQIQTKIDRPVAEVFAAIHDPAQLCRYFAVHSDGALEDGATISWGLHGPRGEPLDVPVRVHSVIPGRRICFTWAARELSGGRPQTADYDTTVEITVEPLRAGQTLVRITEGVWAATEAGLQGSYRSCQDWMQMACNLKAFLEYGVDLRASSPKTERGQSASATA